MRDLTIASSKIELTEAAAASMLNWFGLTYAVNHARVPKEAMKVRAANSRYFLVRSTK